MRERTTRTLAALLPILPVAVGTWMIAISLDRIRGLSPPLTLGLALLGGLLLALALCAHEDAHQAAARALRVRRVSLRLYIPADTTTVGAGELPAWKELLIGAAGPAASFVFGLALLGASERVSALALPDVEPRASLATSALAATLGWVGGFSVLYGTLNLLPAFPLDGGWIARAAARILMADALAATRLAAKVGLLTGGLVGALGIAAIVEEVNGPAATEVPSGFWLLTIGWSLLVSSERVDDQVTREQKLHGAAVGQFTRPLGPTIEGRATVDDLLRHHLLSFRERPVAVVDGEALCGVVTVENLRRTVGLDWNLTPVRQIMTPVSASVCASIADTALEALARLDAAGTDLLIVVDGVRPVGTIHRNDIAHWWSRQLRSE